MNTTGTTTEEATPSVAANTEAPVVVERVIPEAEQRKKDDVDPSVVATAAPPHVHGQKSDANAESPDLPAGAVGRDVVAEFEVIGGFSVHPFASKFPLLAGREFDDLVESIRMVGVASAVELHDGLLIDGRNRVRAVEELRRQGHEVPFRPVEWVPRGSETVEEHIFAVNVYRRHLTDDQRAVLATELLPAIRAAKANAQAATRFGACRKDTVATNSGPPAGSAPTPRSRRERAEASTVGQIAKLGKVSPYKAGQAVALVDGVKAGAVAPEQLDDVRHGKKLLREAAPGKKKPPRPKPSPKRTVRTEAEMVFDGPDDADAASGSSAVPASFEEEVRRAWKRFKGAFAIADHRELRVIVAKILKEERHEFDR